MATVKKNKKKIIVPICIVLVIAIIVGVAFGVSAATGGEEVSLYTISTDDIYENVSLTGQVSSGTEKEYKVATVATVKEVFVKPGDKVKKGDVLATFETESLDSEISSLRSSYNSSLSAYNEAVKEQKEAQNKANSLKSQIAETENEIQRLENQSDFVTTAKRTTARTTTKRATTTKATTTRVTTTKNEPSSETTTKTTTTATPGSEISSLTEALAELNENLTQITDSVETLATTTEIIADVITQAFDEGVFDSDVIADRVAKAVSEAVYDGIIDSATLLVDSGTAADMIHAAVSSIDFESIATSVTNSKNVSLTAAQIQLASQEALYTIYDAKADQTTVNLQKKAVDATKTALDALEQQQEDMKNGWIASFDGTVTEVDVTPGVQTTALSTGIKLENLDSMAVTVSLSEYDVHKVKVGMPATVTTAYGTYEAEVTSIAPTATGGSSSGILDSVGSMAGISGLSSLTDTGAGVECTVSIPQTDENIIAGFDADVEIATGEYLGVVVVPIESIKLEKTGSYVYIYNEEEGTVTKTKIETGAVSDSAYEVKSGLKVGDRIISAPATDYEEDTFKVKVVEQ